MDEHDGAGVPQWERLAAVAIAAFIASALIGAAVADHGWGWVR